MNLRLLELCLLAFLAAAAAGQPAIAKLAEPANDAAPAPGTADGRTANPPAANPPGTDPPGTDPPGTDSPGTDSPGNYPRAADSPAADPAAVDVDALVSAARSALARGDTDRALSLANDAVKGAPERPLAYALRAGVHDARREFARSVLDYDRVVAAQPDNPAARQRRGEALFRLGRFKDSVSDFDKVVELDPSRAPYHWQRGISLYYAGEFERGAEQFELHKTVNPDDVENAVWHYLCVAATAGEEKARAGLIPIAHDARVPMMEVHALYAGQSTPEKVLAAAGAGAPAPAELKQRLFYAHLYIGLHGGAGFPPAGSDAGKTPAPPARAEADKHIRLAAEKYADDDYMGDVARAHVTSLKRVE
jgi:lipoprotein NlpI